MGHLLILFLRKKTPVCKFIFCLSVNFCAYGDIFCFCTKNELQNLHRGGQNLTLLMLNVTKRLETISADSAYKENYPLLT